MHHRQPRHAAVGSDPGRVCREWGRCFAVGGGGVPGRYAGAVCGGGCRAGAVGKHGGGALCCGQGECACAVSAGGGRSSAPKRRGADRGRGCGDAAAAGCDGGVVAGGARGAADGWAATSGDSGAGTVACQAGGAREDCGDGDGIGGRATALKGFLFSYALRARPAMSRCIECALSAHSQRKRKAPATATPASSIEKAKG
jgi:hypothetical protein